MKIRLNHPSRPKQTARIAKKHDIDRRIQKKRHKLMNDRLLHNRNVNNPKSPKAAKKKQTKQTTLQKRLKEYLKDLKRRIAAIKKEIKNNPTANTWVLKDTYWNPNEIMFDAIPDKEAAKLIEPKIWEVGMALQGGDPDIIRKHLNETSKTIAKIQKQALSSKKARKHRKQQN